jgi:hypothetical protein
MKEDKTVFIERKKKKSFVELFNDLISNFNSRILKNQYKSEKMIWKVLYDKIYRKDLFEMLMNAENEKDKSFLRNIYYVKQDNETFPLIKTNEQLNEDDLEVYYENNYLQGSNKLYKFETYSYYMYIPLLCLSSYYRIKNNTKIFNLTAFLFMTVLATNFSAFYKRKKFYETSKEKVFEADNQKALSIYKTLFYIDI